MPNLFPTSEKSQTINTDSIATNKVVGFKPGILRNLTEGEVVRDGQNKTMSATGIESWKQWCFNCLNTQRYSCKAYSTDFGIDIEGAIKAESREETEALLEMDIREALLADPYKRTKSVPEIVFNWLAPDSLEITVTIVGINDATIDVTTTIAA